MSQRRRSEMSPEIQNRGTSGPQKGHVPAKKKWVAGVIEIDGVPVPRKETHHRCPKSLSSLSQPLAKSRSLPSLVTDPRPEISV